MRGPGAAFLLAAALAAAGPARAAEVELSGTALTAEPLSDGAERRLLPGGRARIRMEGDLLVLDGKAVDGAGLLFTASGSIRHAGRDLSGEVEVRRAPGGLAVIDVLPMESYVAAVIGGEMPLSFPPEALKAQAVAARTFAVGKK